MTNFGDVGKALSGAISPSSEKLFAPFVAVSADPVILRLASPGRTELYSWSLESFLAGNNFVPRPLGNANRTLPLGFSTIFS